MEANLESVKAENTEALKTVTDTSRKCHIHFVDDTSLLKILSPPLPPPPPPRPPPPPPPRPPRPPPPLQSRWPSLLPAASVSVMQHQIMKRLFCVLMTEVLKSLNASVVVNCETTLPPGCLKSRRE